MTASTARASRTDAAARTQMNPPQPTPPAGPDAPLTLSVFGPAMLVRRARGDSVHDGPALSLAQRRLLERLALAAPSPVGLDELADAIWEREPPAQARATIQNQISRIRSGWGKEVVHTLSDGYALGVPTDAARLRDLSARTEILLEDGDARTAFELADAALRLWDGQPYASIEHVAGVGVARRALAASGTAIENTRLAAGIALGRSGWAAHEAERLVGEAPHDERRLALHARALALAGRRGDALAALAAARRRLRTDLGIEAGPLLLDAEEQIVSPRIGISRRRRWGTFVGRAVELRSVLTGVAARRVIAVHGETGAGVTRLLDEARGQLSGLGVRVIAVSALEHLDSATGILGDILDELGVGVSGGESPVPRFVDAVAKATVAAPICLLIDDAHELGRTAAGALRAAAERESVMLILGGHRSGWWQEGDVDVTLSGLDRDAIARLLLWLPLKEVTTELIDHLHARTGGNPLALALILDSSAEDPRELLVAAPAGIGMLAQRLLDGLGPDAAQLVVRAAVAGDGYAVSALVRDGVELPGEVLEETAEGTVRFRHEVLREVVLGNIPPAHREELHLELGRAARAADAAPAIVARHLHAAAPLVPEEAAAACREAAAAASAEGAHADAVDWLEQADRIAGLPEALRLELRIELGDELRLTGDPAHLDVLIAAADRAIELDDEPLVAAALFALLQLGASSGAGSVVDGVQRVLALGLPRLVDPALRAPVMAAASLAWSLTGDSGRSRALFDEADALATGDRVRGRVLPFAYMALALPGDVHRRGTLAAELLDIAGRADDPVAVFEGHQLDFSVRLMCGDGDGARAAAALMGELVEPVGDVGRRWAQLFCAAAIAHLDGDDERCELLADRAYGVFADVSPARATAAWMGQLLAVRLVRGRLGELTEQLADLVASQPGIPAWHAALALALVQGGRDATQATAHALAALDLTATDNTWLASHAVGARAAAAIGDASTIEAYLDRLSPWSGAGVWQGTCSYGPVDTPLAMLHRARGDEDAAREHARRAEALCRRLGARPFLEELRRTGLGR